MATKKRQLLTGEAWAGVDVGYDPHYRHITLSGWYDSSVGIAPETMTLTRFLFLLGITETDVHKALETVAWSRCANCEATAWTHFDGEAGICVDDKACVERCDERRRKHEAAHDDADDADDSEAW